MCLLQLTGVQGGTGLKHTKEETKERRGEKVNWLIGEEGRTKERQNEGLNFIDQKD